MNKTIQGIEDNPFKNRTREAIVNQAVEWGQPIDAVTLPAEHWLFEKQLLQACPDAMIRGCEMDKKIYAESLTNKPKSDKVSLRHAPIYAFDDYGRPRNFAWFDYCGPAYGGDKWGFQRIEAPAKLIQALNIGKKSGLVYVTYCMTCRFITVDEMRRKIWGGNLSLAGAIKRRLWSEIGVKSGDNVHLVLETYYLGGDDQKTPMLTLGFQVGELTVTPFNADWSIEVKAARLEAHAAKYGGDYIPPEQERIVAALISEANQECERLETAYKSLRLITLDNKELIALAHKMKLNTAAIHKLFGSGVYAVPRVKSVNRLSFFDYERYKVSRRNVGSTVAHLPKT